MSDIVLNSSDLPLGTIFPEAPYNIELARAIEADKAGDTITQKRMRELEKMRRALWTETEAKKAASMKGYARFAARQYGFDVDANNLLTFEWMESEYRRVGYQSDFYACDLAKKELVPVGADHERPHVIVFATGRAFAEKNARLGQIAPESATEAAGKVMSAQVYLVGTRLVPGYADSEVQVTAVAYDMVTSEEETPALRFQAILDPSFLHQVSVRAAERIFGPLIGELESFPTGRLVRREGHILGKAFPDEKIIDNISRVVFVGGSVGCIVSLQAARWLDVLLEELGVSETVRIEVARSLLVVNLGPTTPLAAGDHTNLISVVNSVDEFVFAGNDIASIITRVQAQGRRLIPTQATDDPRGANSYSLVLDVDGSINPHDGRLVFNPLGTHFGHSLKYYANGLREVGFKMIIGRALARRGSFRIGEIIADAVAAGELDISWTPPEAI